MMRKTLLTVAALMITVAAGGWANGNEKAAPAAEGLVVSTSAVGLYPNDFGPDEIDVAEYPKEMRATYHVFKFKCAACHTIARPINSQFVELNADEVAKLKKDDPAALADDRVLMADESIWKRYVKRMMGKPGCPVKKEDGKPIWEFLVYDSKIRKTGDNAAAWRKHRKHLLHDFSVNYPDTFKKVFDDRPAPAEEK
jgi:mono/diheme cytochrome c family protein